MINDDLRAVAELFAFVAANPNEALGGLGPAPWQQLTSTHAHVLALAGDSHLLRTRQVKQGQRRGDLRQGVVVDVLAVFGVDRSRIRENLTEPARRAPTGWLTAADADDPAAILTGRRAG